MGVMLKSTHRPLETHVSDHTAPPLPWTEHIAPTGHTYYYNTETQQSTYTRPVQIPPVAGFPVTTTVDTPHGYLRPIPHIPNFRSNGNFDLRDRRPHRRQDRPKHRYAIPGCAPWILVKTKLRRRFVHNPETGESFWNFSKDVTGGVVEFDIQERRKREELETGGSPVIGSNNGQNGTATEITEGQTGTSADPALKDVNEATHESDEYEEVEVTDEEDEENQGPSKRQKSDEEDKIQKHAVELGEEDMAYQLAQMGQNYQLDPGEYGQADMGYDGEEWAEGAEGLPLTSEEATTAFEDLLNDYNINPFWTWETVIEDGRVVEDDRYTLLPNMKSRKDVFAAWSAAKIQTVKAQREKQARQDPRIPFLSLLHEHATPKLYWPEFRRKFKRMPEMRDMTLSDKEREKLYREHINRTTKIPPSTLKTDLMALMRSIPLSDAWNCSTTLSDALPPALLTDLRYISLKREVRDPLIEEYIRTLPDWTDSMYVQRTDTTSASVAEKHKQDEALHERQRQVDEERMRQAKDLHYGQSKLRQEEAQLERAMKIGKDGLKDHLNTLPAE